MYFLLLFRKFLKQLFKLRRFQIAIRLAEGVCKLYSDYQKPILINDFDGSLKFYCQLNEHIGSQIFWRGAYSGDQLLLMKRLLKPEMVFIDVGANQGEFTVFAANRVGRKGLVIAFEPYTLLFKKLCQNIEINGFNNVCLLNLGLGKKSKELPIFTGSKRFIDGTVNEGLATFYKTDSKNIYLGQAKLISLDDFVAHDRLQKIDLIKIDVEGSELAVLQGARHSLKKFKPVILLEVAEENCQAAGYSGKELLAFLEALGYHFKLILTGGQTIPIELEQCGVFQNVICCPNSHKAEKTQV